MQVQLLTQMGFSFMVFSCLCVFYFGQVITCHLIAIIFDLAIIVNLSLSYVEDGQNEGVNNVLSSLAMDG